MTSSLPKITIIIGVYNMRQWLGAAIESVLAQNYNSLELIIMDGGSTDGTVDVIKQYEQYITYWISEKDKGHPDACNRAIDIATGDYIGFLNADDQMEKSLLHKVAQCITKNPQTELITCGIRIIENGQILREVFSPELLQLTFYNMLFEHTLFNARFYKKSLFKRFGKFNANDITGHVNRSNDREFLLRLARNAVQSEIIPEPLYTYLFHQNASSSSKSNRERIHTEHILLAQQLLSESLNTHEKIMVKTWLAREYVYLFLTYVQQRKIIKSLQAGLKGIMQTHLRWMTQLTKYTFKKLRFCHKHHQT